MQPSEAKAMTAKIDEVPTARNSLEDDINAPSNLKYNKLTMRDGCPVRRDRQTIDCIAHEV